MPADEPAHPLLATTAERLLTENGGGSFSSMFSGRANTGHGSKPLLARTAAVSPASCLRAAAASRRPRSRAETTRPGIHGRLDAFTEASRFAGVPPDRRDSPAFWTHPAQPPITSLDLDAAGIRAIVWATAHRTDFGWIALPAFADSNVARSASVSTTSMVEPLREARYPARFQHPPSTYSQAADRYLVRI